MLSVTNKMAIDAFLCHQFLVCSTLNNLTLVHHKYLVSMTNRFQPVCNHNYCFFMRYLLHGFHQLLLIFWIYIGCGFIQNNNRRIFQHRAGNGNALSFATGKMSATASDLCFKAFLKSHNKIITTTVLCSLFHLCIRRILFSHADILPHSSIKQKVILRYICNEAVIMFG